MNQELTLTESESWWFNDAKKVATKKVVEMALGVTGAWIEIGCWEGNSTCFIADLIKPQKLHAVDHWQGSPNDFTGWLINQRTVHDTFAANVKDRNNIIEHQMSWEEFFKSWSEPIAFIHLDADHQYESVTGMIEAALPYMAPGGMIVGQDWEWLHVPRALDHALTLGAVTHDGGTWWWKNEA